MNDGAARRIRFGKLCVGLRIFVDGNRIDAEGPPIRTIGGLVRYLERRGVLGGRLVDQIAIGELVFHDWEGNNTVALPEDADIQVTTQSVADLIASTIQTAAEYLPKLEAGAVRAAALLQEGRERESFDVIGGLVDGLQWYSDILGSLAALLPHEQRRASERLTGLTAVTEQVLAALEAQDYTLLADLLEYELAAELQTNMEYVAALSKSDGGSVEKRG